ncbi:MAG: TetR/AcrR family transcriptional regulator [Pseudomonadota bacterium]
MLDPLTLASITRPSRKRITAIAQKTAVQKKGSYHHGDLRAQLVEATRTLVETKGPDKFSVSEACRLAGVSTAAPYRHFGDKTDMLIAVAMDGMERQRMQMEAVVAQHPRGTIDSIAALGELYIQFAQREEGVFRLAFGLTRDHEDRADMTECGQRCFGVVVEEVRRYLNRPAPDGPVMERAFSLWTLVHGMSFLMIDQKLGVMTTPLDIPTLVRENTIRLLAR